MAPPARALRQNLRARRLADAARAPAPGSRQRRRVLAGAIRRGSYREADRLLRSLASAPLPKRPERTPRAARCAAGRPGAVFGARNRVAFSRRPSSATRGAAPRPISRCCIKSRGRSRHLAAFDADLDFEPRHRPRARRRRRQLRRWFRKPPRRDRPCARRRHSGARPRRRRDLRGDVDRRNRSRPPRRPRGAMGRPSRPLRRMGASCRKPTPSCARSARSRSPTRSPRARCAPSGRAPRIEAAFAEASWKQAIATDPDLAAFDGERHNALDRGFQGARSEAPARRHIERARPASGRRSRAARLARWGSFAAKSAASAIICRCAS